jgi:uncharacterized protein DUF2442
MLRDIVEVRATGGHRLFLRFDDGQSGELDLDRTVKFTGVFAPLKDPHEFAKVFVHPEFHTVSWPNNVDLDSDVLYARVTGLPLQEEKLSATQNSPRRAAKAGRVTKVPVKRKPGSHRSMARTR